MNKNFSQICILGGGFGGLYTALYLSRFPQVKTGKWQIALVEPKDHFIFTPLLYELITGELQRWEIAPSYTKLLASTNIELCQQRVKNIDFKTRQVQLTNDRQLSYDYLVLAVGSQNRWADIPGLSTHALTFRTLEDVERLQNQLHFLETSERRCIRVNIIGAGPSGVELACKLADRLGKRGQISLISRGEDILKGFSAGVKKASWHSLFTRGVKVEINTEIEAIEADSITLIQNNQPIQTPVDLVIWVAGIESKEWVRQLDCQQTAKGKLLTYPSLQLIDYPEVFALGDVADFRQGKKSVPATAQVAFQQASCAAKNIAAIIQNKPLKAFHYHHLGEMLTLGKRSALISSFGINLDGRLADIFRRLIYILRLPTFRHRLQVLKSWSVKVTLKIKRLFRWHINQILEQISLRN